MSIIFPEGITFVLRYLSIYDTNPGVIPTNLKYAVSYQDRTVYDGNIDTSNVTDMSYMFYNCSKLKHIPLLDTSNVTNMSGMFHYCNSLGAIPDLDTSNVTNMSNMFNNCFSLESIPDLDTSNVTNMSNMFSSCTKLISIPLLDCGKVTSISPLIGYVNIITLTDLGGFKNIKVNFDIQKAPNLTIQSLMNVINNLYDFKANGETTVRTLTLGTTNLNKLTDEQKAVATNKGWNLT